MNKPGRGGQREGAGRKPKGEGVRVQKSVSLTPTVWDYIDRVRGDKSESDIIEAVFLTLLTTAPSGRGGE